MNKLRKSRKLKTDVTILQKNLEEHKHLSPDFVTQTFWVNVSEHFLQTIRYP